MGFFKAKFEPHHETHPALFIRCDGGYNRLNLVRLQAPTPRITSATSAASCSGISLDSPDFAPQLAPIMLLIGSRGEETAETHGTPTGGDFR